MTTDASTIDSVRTEEIEHPDTIANQAFGFWLYLMSDLVLFATIFATFAVLRQLRRRSHRKGPLSPSVRVRRDHGPSFQQRDVWAGRPGYAPGKQGPGPKVARRHVSAGSWIHFHGGQ